MRANRNQKFVVVHRRRVRSVGLFDAFLLSGNLAARLLRLTDRQVAQLMFDHVGDGLAFGSPESLICAEATERLFRSAAGIRKPHECFNEAGELPKCPRCGSEMMRFIGICEPDYRECVSVQCGLKLQNGTGKEEDR